MQIRAHVSRLDEMEFGLDAMVVNGHVQVHFPFFKTQQEWLKCCKCSCNGVVYKQQGGASVRRDVRSHLISARQPAGALCAMHCYE